MWITSTAPALRRPQALLTSPRALQLLLTVTLALGFTVAGPWLQERHTNGLAATQTMEDVRVVPPSVEAAVFAAPAPAPRSEVGIAMPAIATFAPNGDAILEGVTSTN